MNKNIIFFISVGLIILTLVSVIVNLIASNKVLERQVYYASIIVADFGGLAANGSAFIFGAVPQGSSSEKKLSVKNGYDFPVVAYIIPENEMEQFVQAKQEFIPASQERNISIVATAPAGIEKKDYEGNIVVEIRRR